MAHDAAVPIASLVAAANRAGAAAHVVALVGKDFGRLLGADDGTSWGHITTDGIVANYESLWLACNLKSFPLAVKSVSPELLKDLDEWQLLNLPLSKILDLLDETKKNGSCAKILATRCS